MQKALFEILNQFVISNPGLPGEKSLKLLRVMKKISQSKTPSK